MSNRTDAPCGNFLVPELMLPPPPPPRPAVNPNSPEKDAAKRTDAPSKR